MKKKISKMPVKYLKFLTNVKNQIQRAQIKAAVYVNRELIALYWNIGKQILQLQKQEGWGKSIVEQLSKDLRREFPSLKGFSPRNLWEMRSFYDVYKDAINLQQLVAEIPWGHNLALIHKIKHNTERLWYIRKTIEHGWSRNVLIHQIESNAYHRSGKAITNFRKTLPPIQSDLAHQIIKDPYKFDFLTIEDNRREKELENNLIQHLEQFLLELGVGFAFVGRQKHLEIGDQDFYIDLLFYHTRLHAYIVIELKNSEFKPEYAGKMNFYLNAVDDLFKHPQDHPSIGIILCKTKNKVVVEYTLRDTHKPIGVSEYKLTKKLPKNFKGSLPTIEELEHELSQKKEKKI
ncbi:MAG: PDDEXK nuclease domain-containing protein [Candidatus Omnitrophota bacterium]|nr:PDDEXK nuclease domain-containing protein [Candidatus Omnitrophota bacterium]